MIAPPAPGPRRPTAVLAGLGLALVAMFSLASARPRAPWDDEAPAQAAPPSPRVRPEIVVFLASYPELGRPAEILPAPDPSNPDLHAIRTDRGRELHFLVRDHAVRSIMERDPATGLASPL